MTRYKPGDIVLLDFPFTDGSEARRRPALILLDTGDDDVLVARVTSQSRTDTFDVEITNWRNAGLLLPSIARLHKLATIEKALIVRTLGKLHITDRTTVAQTFEKLFDVWKE